MGSARRINTQNSYWEEGKIMRLVCCANSSGASTFVFLINIPCSNMCHKPQGLLSLDMYYNSIISGLRNHACSKNYADACSKNELGYNEYIYLSKVINFVNFKAHIKNPYMLC